MLFTSWSKSGSLIKRRMSCFCKRNVVTEKCFKVLVNVLIETAASQIRFNKSDTATLLFGFYTTPWKELKNKATIPYPIYLKVFIWIYLVYWNVDRYAEHFVWCVCEYLHILGRKRHTSLERSKLNYLWSFLAFYSSFRSVWWPICKYSSFSVLATLLLMNWALEETRYVNVTRYSIKFE